MTLCVALWGGNESQMVVMADALTTSPESGTPVIIPSSPTAVLRAGSSYVRGLRQKTAIVNGWLLFMFAGSVMIADEIVRQLRINEHTLNRDHKRVMNLIHRTIKDFPKSTAQLFDFFICTINDDNFIWSTWKGQSGKHPAFHRYLALGTGSLDFLDTLDSDLANQAADTPVTSMVDLINSAISFMGFSIAKQGKTGFALDSKWGGALEIVVRNRNSFFKLDNVLLRTFFVEADPHKNFKVMLDENFYYHYYLEDELIVCGSHQDTFISQQVNSLGQNIQSDVVDYKRRAEFVVDTFLVSNKLLGAEENGPWTVFTNTQFSPTALDPDFVGQPLNDFVTLAGSRFEWDFDIEFLRTIVDGFIADFRNGRWASSH